MKHLSIDGNPIMETIPEGKYPYPQATYLDHEEGCKVTVNVTFYEHLMKVVEIPDKRIFDDYYQYFKDKAFDKLCELFVINAKQ